MSGPDLSEFYKLSRPKKPPCQVGHARAQLKPDEQTQLDAAVGTDKGIITSGAIQHWLKARKHDVSVPAISMHRAGRCTCAEADDG